MCDQHINNVLLYCDLAASVDLQAMENATGYEACPFSARKEIELCAIQRGSPVKTYTDRKKEIHDMKGPTPSNSLAFLISFKVLE